MRNHVPWLGQGDIFANVSIIDVAMTGAGEVQAAVIEGPQSC